MRLDKCQACFSTTIFLYSLTLNKPEFSGRKQNIANFSARRDALPWPVGLRHVHQSSKSQKRYRPFGNAMSLLAVLILTFGGEFVVAVSQSDFYPTGVIADENFEIESNMSIYTASSSHVFVSLYSVDKKSRCSFNFIFGAGQSKGLYNFGKQVKRKFTTQNASLEGTSCCVGVLDRGNARKSNIAVSQSIRQRDFAEVFQ